MAYLYNLLGFCNSSEFISKGCFERVTPLSPTNRCLHFAQCFVSHFLPLSLIASSLFWTIVSRLLVSSSSVVVVVDVVALCSLFCILSQKTPGTCGLNRSTAALNGGADSMVVSSDGQSSLTGVCPKQAAAVIVCRLQPNHHHRQNNPLATANLHRIKDYAADDDHPSLFNPTQNPPRNYGALGPPKSLVRRWSPAKGPIDDPVVRLTHPLCRSPYCLYSTPIDDRRASIYDPICQHHLLLHSPYPPAPPPPPPPQLASHPRITSQPDVVVTSPELDTIHCAENEGSALWGPVDQTQMKEVDAGMRCGVIGANKLAKPEDETWLTSHQDLN